MKIRIKNPPERQCTNVYARLLLKMILGRFIQSISKN